MLKLVLLRHGESLWNMENRFTGWIDIDLSEQGRQEAQRAAGVLKLSYRSFRHLLKKYDLSEKE